MLGQGLGLELGVGLRAKCWQSAIDLCYISLCTISLCGEMDQFFSNGKETNIASYRPSGKRTQQTAVVALATQTQLMWGRKRAWYQMFACALDINRRNDEKLLYLQTYFQTSGEDAI